MSIILLKFLHEKGKQPKIWVRKRKCKAKRYQFSNLQAEHGVGRDGEDIYSQNNQSANAINEGNKC